MQTVAHLSLSVDLDFAGESLRTDLASDVGRVVSKLSELAVRLGIPLTWASTAPQRQIASRGWPKLPATHEWALLVDPAMSSGGGERFARELRRKLAESEAAGLRVTTLALGEGANREFLDPMIRSGIQVLRTAGSSSVRAAEAHPSPTFRSGLLRVAPIARIPAATSWGWRSSENHLRRQLQAGIRDGVAMHFVFDAPRMARSASALKQAERLLSDAADAHDRLGLRIGHLTELARLLRPHSLRRSTCSILRAA